MMNRDKLKTALEEAHRFIARVNALPEPVKRQWSDGSGSYLDDNYPKEQGAIRRSSMDLTRALADLRRPG